MKKIRYLLLLSIIGFCFFLAQRGLAGYITPAEPGTAPNRNGKISEDIVKIDGAERIGNDACYNCHPQDVDYGVSKDEWRRAVHSKVPGAMECENCHGAASLHAKDNNAQDIIMPSKLPPEKQKELCESCHMQGQFAVHGGARLGCLDCHKFHAINSEHFLKYAQERDLCFSCHAQVKAQFNAFTHHPVNEGLMTCTDCHEPHFDSRLTMLKNAPQIFGNRKAVEACGTCHAEEAGPFVFSHSTTVGCLQCHDPHGSPQEMLWKLPQPALCLRCHVASSFQYATMGVQCTECHPAIHGSDRDRLFVVP